MLRMLLQSMEKRLETQPVYKPGRQGSQPGLASRRICWAGAVTGQDPPADQAEVISGRQWPSARRNQQPDLVTLSALLVIEGMKRSVEFMKRKVAKPA